MMCEIYRKSCISSPDQPSPLPVTHKSKQTMERVIHTHTHTHTHTQRKYTYKNLLWGDR